jgi:Methyltransferase FkbM domain
VRFGYSYWQLRWEEGPSVLSARQTAPDLFRGETEQTRYAWAKAHRDDDDRFPARCLAGPWRGIRLYLHRDGDTLKQLGLYEWETNWVYRRYLKPGMTVYDVGAADGSVSLLYAKLVGAAGRVIAFEPEAGRYQSRWSITMDLNATLAPRITLRPEWVRELRGFAHFVKLDVDGAELDILRASSDFIRESRPSWLIETHSVALHRDITRLLTTVHGYPVRSITHAWWRRWRLREGRPDDNYWLMAPGSAVRTNTVRAGSPGDIRAQR